MDFSTLKIPGTDAIRLLREHRSRYPATGQYPFLIGDDNDLRHLKDHLEINNQDPDAIIRTSLNINVPEWISQKAGFEEEESTEELLGDWPGEIHHKGSIG